MSRIFLSHSSKDKAIVKRVAVDLLHRNIPVWLDAWELSPGDVLLHEIENGIANNDMYLVFLSRNALESSWVLEELDLAFAKEKEINKKFVIPLLLEDVDIPLRLRKKVFLRIHDSYNRTIEAIENLAIEMKIDERNVEFKDVLVPIVLYDGRRLDRAQLEERLVSVAKLKGTNEFSPSQLLFHDDPKYEASRLKCTALIDAIDHHVLTATQKEEAKERYRFLRKVDKALSECVSAVINQYKGPYSALDVLDISYWTILYGRGRQLIAMRHLLGLFGEESDDYLDDVSADLTSSGGACEFFGVSDVALVAIFSEEDRRYVKFWVDQDDVACRELYSTLGQPWELVHMWIGDFINKYALPQILIKRYLHEDSSIPVIWSPDGWRVGID